VPEGGRGRVGLRGVLVAGECERGGHSREAEQTLKSIDCAAGMRFGSARSFGTRRRRCCPQRHAPDRFRIVHYSVQSNHVHLIVEAAERRALTAGIHGLEARLTRYINQLLNRRGPLWADRWHGRALASPSEVRNALVYVLANFRKHASHPMPHGVDPCSSAA
jgi:REP element-mobilizing transposase RayT